MPRKKIKNRKPPPCPDPERYHWVESEDGGYWRKNRESKTINSSFKKKTKEIEEISPFGATLRKLLADFTVDLRMGRLGNRFNKALFTSLRETGKLMPQYLKGIEFQKEHFLSRLVHTGYFARHDKAHKTFTVTIPLVKNSTIKKISSLLTGYQFTAILIYQPRGSGREMQLLSTGSEVYKFNTDETACTLTLQLPSKAQWWILILRADTYEGKILALHHKHRGMAILDGGGTVK